MAKSQAVEGKEDLMGRGKKIGKATQASEKNREDNEGEIEGAAPVQPAREPPSRHGESSEIRTERKKKGKITLRQNVDEDKQVKLSHKNQQEKSLS